MAQPTPGPWVAEKRESGAVVVRAAEGIREPVAEIWHNGHDAEANGALVALAPDLLAFAEKVVAHSTSEAGGGDVIQFLVSLQDLAREAKQLLAKAETP